MNGPSREDQQRLARQWESTGRKLEIIRRERLGGMPYDWASVDALLEMGDHWRGPSRSTSGLVEMQRWFTKFAAQSRRK